MKFKPAYLIYGNDHGRLVERRAKLRALAEREAGAQGVEVFTGDTSTAADVAAALSAVTFAIGRRFLIVDGVERWKQSELEPLVNVLTDPPPATTVTFFAREEGRLKAPKKLHELVERAGGEVSAEQTVKPWELPRWLVTEAKRQGVSLDNGAARLLVAQTGERQQRLLRELEKCALAAGDGPVTTELVNELGAYSADHKVWTLADAFVEGDSAQALRTYLQLRAQGERLGGLLFWLVQRVRQAHEVALQLAEGVAASQVKRTLRMPPKAADRFIAAVRKSDPSDLQRLLCKLAELEVVTRGGGQPIAEDTLAVRLIATN